jgi:hypothetical protein
MKVEVGFAADLIALHLKAAFVFAVDQNVTKVEVLDENDGCGVVDDILQALFAYTKRFFGVLSIAVFPCQFGIESGVL